MSFTSQLCLAILLCIPIGLFDLHPDAQDSGFHPERQAPIIQRSRHFTIRLKKDGEKLGVWIDKGSHPIGSFWLPDEMAQVDRIEVVANNHAVLLGYANGDVNEIVIVDLNSGKMIDKIWCFAPALSPKKRFLAFVKFYIPHFLQGVSDEYMVYDFEKSPKMNRPAGIPSDDFRNVGRAVYPVGATNKPDDNIAKPEPEIHKLASGQFFWAPDEEQLAFADRYQDKVFVIEASFLDSRVILKQSEIKKSNVCPSKQISCSFGLSSIQFFAREHLKIKLRPYNVGMPIKSEIDLDLSQVPVASYLDLDRELLVFIANSM